MKRIPFIKMQGAGNDFVLIEDAPSFSSQKLSQLAKKMCHRKYGIGADGLLVVARSKTALARMRIFNADGTEPDMCGNGARCFALYIARKKKKKDFLIETKAGILKARIAKDRIRLNMTDPRDFKLGVCVQGISQVYRVDYVNTGVPHVVMVVDDLDHFAVKEMGRFFREHAVFAPEGTNVNFVKICAPKQIRVRTYERGVEDETLACGTGSVASAIMTFLSLGEIESHEGKVVKMDVETSSGDTLKVYFKVSHKIITDVWLEGAARIVFKGEYYV